MSSALDIIKIALRDLGVIYGSDEPQASDRAVALERLKVLLPQLEQGYGGIDLLDIKAGSGNATLTLVGGERVNITDNTALTVNFPAVPQDGSRISLVNTTTATSGNITIPSSGFVINGYSAPFTMAAYTQRNYTFLAHLGQWTQITLSLESDTIPYPPEFDILLGAKLAETLAEVYDVELGAGARERANMCVVRLAERYGPRLKRRGRTISSGDKHQS